MVTEKQIDITKEKMTKFGETMSLGEYKNVDELIHALVKYIDDDIMLQEA